MKPTMMVYYQEKETGDYLAVDHSTATYYRAIGQPDMREGRATCISGLPSSMATTGISLKFIRRKCQRVYKRDVPREWIAYIG